MPSHALPSTINGVSQVLPRRQFLKTAGIGLLGSALFPERIFSTPGASDTAGVALQLYSLRNQIQENITATLLHVASIGINTVETAFWPEDMSVIQAASYLKNAGLSVCSAHVELPVGDKKAAMLKTAEAFGCQRVIWHGWPEDKRYSTLDGTRELIDIYNEAYHFASANGLQFGLHNHWWEFRNKVGGRFVYERLLENLDPGIFFEIDTYWVKVAGHDPAKIVEQFGKRAPMLHLKDGPARWSDSLAVDQPEPMVAVGKGTQNFPGIVGAAKGNTEWMVIEMDVTSTDVFAAIKDSYDYLIKNKYAKNKRAD